VKNNRSLMIVVLAMAFMALPLQSHAQKAYKDATGGFMNVTQFVNCGAGCTASASNITPVDVGGYTSAMIAVNVTAVSGTSPSLTVNFQACDGNGGSAPATSNLRHSHGVNRYYRNRRLFDQGGPFLALDNPELHHLGHHAVIHIHCNSVFQADFVTRQGRR